MNKASSVEFVRKHPKTVATVAVGATAIAVLKGLSLHSGYEVQEEKSAMHATVQKIEAMKLACDAKTTITEAGSTDMTLHLPKGHLPGSGFTFYLRGGEGKKGTEATIKTLTCVEKPKMQDNFDEATEKHFVNIDRSGISFYSAYAEGKHTVVANDKPLAAAGEMWSKGIKGITLGHVNTYDGYTESLKAKGQAFTEDYGLYNADKKCGSMALQFTEAVFNEAIMQQAESKGIDRDDVAINWYGDMPESAGQYNLSPDDSNFKIDAKKFTSDTCVISGDVVQLARQDAEIYRDTSR